MNVAVLSCKNIKDETCIACHRCLMGFDKKEGEFERYKDTDAKLRGLLHCGGCPGTSPVLRLVGLKTWMAPMGESIDAVHIGIVRLGKQVTYPSHYKGRHIRCQFTNLI